MSVFCLIRINLAWESTFKSELWILLTGKFARFEQKEDVYIYQSFCSKSKIVENFLRIILSFSHTLKYISVSLFPSAKNYSLISRHINTALWQTTINLLAFRFTFYRPYKKSKEIIFNEIFLFCSCLISLLLFEFQLRREKSHKCQTRSSSQKRYIINEH